MNAWTIRNLLGMTKKAEKQRLDEIRDRLKQVNGKLDKIEATLNGENGWFLEMEKRNG